jgi:hypothetical protein
MRTVTYGQRIGVEPSLRVIARTRYLSVTDTLA